MKLDKIYTNGNFYHSKDDYDSIGIKDGIIQVIGHAKNMDMNHSSEIINLHGQSVYPGFIDTHIHLLSYCWKKFYEVDLSGVKSSQEIVSRVANFIKNNNINDNEWIVGSGWNQEEFADGKLPDKYVLDQIPTNHPIFLNRACYHICVVNSKGLEIAKINSETRCSEGGAIDVDELGNPTGILRENAELLVLDLIPSLNDKELMKELIIKGCFDLAKVGITTVHTDDFAFVDDAETLLTAYKELATEDKLPIKVVLQLRASELAHISKYKELGLKSWESYHNLMIGPIKIIADGSLGSRTAALIEPYSDDMDNKGIMTITPEKLEELTYESLFNDFDMAIHAIGDKTMTIILDIYEKYIDEYNKRGFRPSIIHCQIASKEILNRFEKLNIIANIQPIFLNTDWSMAGNRVGTKRLEYSYCWKKYLDLGITCIGSSDAPIESFNPLLGIYSAVTRKDLEGKPATSWIPEEKLSMTEGIKLFTENAAFASKEEQVKGGFRLGSYCDFVILSDDLTTINPEYIKKVEVLQTIVNGKVVNKQGIYSL